MLFMSSVCYSDLKPMDVKSAEFVKSRMSPLPKKVELLGYLETTWHHIYGINYDLMFFHGGNSAWNGGEAIIEGTSAVTRMQVSRHIIDVENDGKLSKYEVQGKARYQVKVDMPN